ncbi:MAG: hypothetical protein AB7S77_22140, partial [Desulfatirhabdiaceae bacterium]
MQIRLITVLFIGICLFGSLSLAATEPVGKITFLKGQVFVERNGQKNPGALNDPVYLKDRLQTEANSSAEIAFLDNSRIRMASGTLLEITEFLYQPGTETRQGLMSLLAGKARFLVQTLQNFKQKQFRVQTQTAVVGTRDTDFLVWVASLTETYALCLENTISLINTVKPDQEAILSAFMYSVIQGENPPSPPAFIPQDQLTSVVQELQEIGNKKSLIGEPPSIETSESTTTTLTTSEDGGGTDTTTNTTTSPTTTETTTVQGEETTSTTVGQEQTTTSSTTGQTTTTTAGQFEATSTTVVTTTSTTTTTTTTSEQPATTSTTIPDTTTSSTTTTNTTTTSTTIPDTTTSTTTTTDTTTTSTTLPDTTTSSTTTTDTTTTSTTTPDTTTSSSTTTDTTTSSTTTTDTTTTSTTLPDTTTSSTTTTDTTTTSTTIPDTTTSTTTTTDTTTTS